MRERGWDVRKMGKGDGVLRDIGRGWEVGRDEEGGRRKEKRG